MFLVTFFTLFVTIFHRIDSVNSFQFARNFQSHLVKHQTNRITLPRNRCETIKFSSTIDENDDEDEIMEAESSSSSPPPVAITNIEKAWRHVKKPLLRIGSKGAAPSHGNSLRQLLEQHDTVKVKINTWKLGSLDEAFDVLRDLAEKSGAPEGIELLHTRKSDNTILFGKPGMTDLIEKGVYPPPATSK